MKTTCFEMKAETFMEHRNCSAFFVMQIKTITTILQINQHLCALEPQKCVCTQNRTAIKKIKSTNIQENAE